VGEVKYSTSGQVRASMRR